MTASAVETDTDLGRIQLGELRVKPRTLGAVGGVALVVGLVIAISSGSLPRLMHGYLLSVMFFLSVSLGALFFVLLQHVTGARWSVVVRRIAELLTTALPTLGLLMLPIVLPLLFGDASLYEWNDANLRSTDTLIQGKAAYLNAPFFALRCVAFFASWILLARFYRQQSLRQDTTADPGLSARMQRWSGPGLILFALTVNFAAFDWLMSLDPHWFSTIFGVYYFAGCAVAIFATLPLATVGLQRNGYLTGHVTTEHFHDLGKLLFGFIFFWAYIAFSQYLLIWYANIPEETGWFYTRQNGGWQYVSLVLVFGHFLIPFLGLMSRSARRHRPTLVFWCVFMLVMHWIDLFWLVMPSVSPDSALPAATDVLCLLGVGALWLAGMLRVAPSMRLIPTGDPHLRDSLAFHNV